MQADDSPPLQPALVAEHKHMHEAPSSPLSAFSPPPLPAKDKDAKRETKRESRRMSWGFSLLTVAAIPIRMPQPQVRPTILECHSFRSISQQQPQRLRDPPELRPMRQFQPPLHLFARARSASTGGVPPQLPLPTRISPFDSLQLSRGANPSSPFAPPPPPPPPINAANSTSPSDLVSPLSDTLAFADRDLHVPAPISKHPPIWNPYTGTPLTEEDGPILDVGPYESAPHVDPAEDAPIDGPRRQPDTHSDLGDDDPASEWVVVDRAEAAPTSSERPAASQHAPAVMMMASQSQPQPQDPSVHGLCVQQLPALRSGPGQFAVAGAAVLLRRNPPPSGVRRPSILMR